MKKIVFSLIVLSLLSCQGGKEDSASVKVDYGLYKPKEDLGQLFIDIQMAGIYADSKTFVDADPKHAPDSIVAFYETARQQDGFDLKDFVETYFDVPHAGEGIVNVDSLKELKSHLISHWDYLTRDPDVKDGYSSLIPLPNP